MTIITWFTNMQDPIVYTSLDDAFTSMMQFMTVSTRKCDVSKYM